ncbi:uncharacterized protein LOC121389355 [Gigantopelta aegis]|uniref:uncharacterized protein LOC121389355 n=1 Tax=Gigantopelta aegis TaxID=1735272 RepID=UPI001B88B192|nr:uncharacterized protein LOC121389355 [Gigantopelta aegis]
MIAVFIIAILPYLCLCERCKEPDMSKLRDLSLPAVHDSFYQIRPLLSTVVGLSDVPAQYVNVQIAKLGHKRKCSKLERLAKRTAGNICPTYHVINYDENRKPSSLLESRCSCKTCFDPNASAELSTLLACQPLMYYTRVLRRFDCRNGTYVYQSTWEPLQVGCTCNFPQHRTSAVYQTPKAPAKRDLRSVFMESIRHARFK